MVQASTASQYVCWEVWIMCIALLVIQSSELIFRKFSNMFTIQNNGVVICLCDQSLVTICPHFDQNANINKYLGVENPYVHCFNTPVTFCIISFNLIRINKLKLYFQSISIRFAESIHDMNLIFFFTLLSRSLFLFFHFYNDLARAL